MSHIVVFRSYEYYFSLVKIELYFDSLFPHKEKLIIYKVEFLKKQNNFTIKKGTRYRDRTRFKSSKPTLIDFLLLSSCLDII